MRRLLCISLIFIMLFAMCGCAKTSIKNYEKVELTFISDKENIDVTLSDSEATKIIDILDRNRYEQYVTACPFSEDVSIKVDGEIYAVACDDCSVIMHMSKGKCFSITEQEMEYIRALFESHGCVFP